MSRPKPDITASPKNDEYIRNYKWDFYLPSDSSKHLDKMTDSVEFTRKSSTVDIDGKQGSVWDIKNVSHLERNLSNTMRINNKYTRLEVEYHNQELLDWGPDDSSSSTVTVGLAGIVPAVNWSFKIGGFSVDDLSSKRDKYGRWAFIDKFGTNKSIKTERGIRTTNTKGNLVLELSHTANFNYPTGTTGTHYTGVITIPIPDR